MPVTLSPRSNMDSVGNANFGSAASLVSDEPLALHQQIINSRRVDRRRI
jgi:hypothetical protein